MDKKTELIDERKHVTMCNHKTHKLLYRILVQYSIKCMKNNKYIYIIASASSSKPTRTVLGTELRTLVRHLFVSFLLRNLLLGTRTKYMYSGVQAN